MRRAPGKDTAVIREGESAGKRIRVLDAAADAENRPAHFPDPRDPAPRHQPISAIIATDIELFAVRYPGGRTDARVRFPADPIAHEPGRWSEMEHNSVGTDNGDES
jgi:hypothetical protein